MITKEVVSFALVNHENEIDCIPLCEVSCVDEMIVTEDLSGEDLDRRIASERKFTQKNTIFRNNSKGKFEEEERSDKNRSSKLIGNAFQIATDTDGYNSGRSYYLQAASVSQKQEIVSLLQHSSKTGG